MITLLNLLGFFKERKKKQLKTITIIRKNNLLRSKHLREKQNTGKYNTLKWLYKFSQGKLKPSSESQFID